MGSNFQDQYKWITTKVHEHEHTHRDKEGEREGEQLVNEYRKIRGVTKDKKHGQP